MHFLNVHLPLYHLFPQLAFNDDSPKDPPRPDASLLEAVMHPERVRYSHACLRWVSTLFGVGWGVVCGVDYCLTWVNTLFREFKGQIQPCLSEEGQYSVRWGWGGGGGGGFTVSGGSIL